MAITAFFFAGRFFRRVLSFFFATARDSTLTYSFCAALALKPAPSVLSFWVAVTAWGAFLDFDVGICRVYHIKPVSTVFKPVS